MDPERILKSAIDASDAFKTVVVTKDNLAFNLCIIGMEEAIIEDRLRRGFDDETSAMTYLHLACAGHSAVLCTKVVTERLDNMPGKLVRMGHLHESGKIAAEHLAII